MTVIHVLPLGNVFRGTLFVTRFNKKKDVFRLLLYFKHMLLPISGITLTHYNWRSYLRKGKAFSHNFILLKFGHPNKCLKYNTFDKILARCLYNIYVNGRRQLGTY